MIMITVTMNRITQLKSSLVNRELNSSFFQSKHITTYKFLEYVK